MLTHAIASRLGSLDPKLHRPHVIPALHRMRLSSRNCNDYEQSHSPERAKCERTRSLEAARNGRGMGTLSRRRRSTGKETRVAVMANRLENGGKDGEQPTLKMGGKGVELRPFAVYNTWSPVPAWPKSWATSGYLARAR
jgi:hypothetical protein